MTNQQAAVWNGDAGDAWVEIKDVLDAMFRPFERMLADAVPRDAALRVLDVGCGTGATTLAIARRLKAPGYCVGVDVSAPMIDAARNGAERADGTAARFLCADAQDHPFAPASFDRIVSRFGVMFFDDPRAAFANLRQAAAEGAALHCFAWRAAAENPFMTTAERAVAGLLPLPPRAPDAPGQFAFARRERVAGILEAAGWRDVAIEPVDVPCAFPAAGLRPYVERMGSVGRALAALPPERGTAVADRALAAFAPFVKDDGVRFDAACWKISART